MALEIDSDDQPSGVPIYEQYVVASRLSSAVPLEDMTSAMADVRARELAGDDGKLVMKREGSIPERNVQLDQEWFEQHAFHIREANAVAAYPPEEMAVAQAYWNGQRDLFNSAREDAITVNPSREKDLPAAIQFDEIGVRQQIQEPDQSFELTL